MSTEWWEEEWRTWQRTKSGLSKVRLPLCCSERPPAASLRGLYDTFPSLLVSVTRLATWTITEVTAVYRWPGLRGAALSFIMRVYVRSSCFTSAWTHHKECRRIEINKTPFTVFFMQTCLFVTINHAFKPEPLCRSLDSHCTMYHGAVKRWPTEMNVTLLWRKHMTTFEKWFLYLYGMAVLKS